MTVTTLVTNQDASGDVSVTIGADVLADAYASLAPAATLLQYILGLAFCVVNVGVLRSLRLRTLREWHYGWLCLGMISAIRVGMEVVPDARITALSFVLARYVLPVISTLDNGFFLLAAVYLWRLGDPRPDMGEARYNIGRWRRRLVGVTILAVGIVITMELAGGNPIARAVEVAFSTATFVTLCAAFVRLSLRMPTPGTLAVIARSAVLVCVLGFSVCGLASQILAIASREAVLTAKVPFLLVSVLVRVLLFGLFYGLVVLQEYRRGLELTSQMADSIREGLVAVDSQLVILQANRAAARILNLAPSQLHHRSLYKVLFGSYFDAMEFHACLRRGESVSNRVVRPAGNAIDQHLLVSAHPDKSTGKEWFAVVSIVAGDTKWGGDGAAVALQSRSI